MLRNRPFDALALRHFSLDVLERGRQFSREARIAGTAQHLLGLGVLLWLSFHSTGSRFVKWLERLGRGHLGLELVTVSTGITLLLAILKLPLAFYSGYWHEHLYDLTRQTVGGWLLDYGRGVALEAGLMLVLWLPLFWLIRKWPRGWWVPAAGVGGLLTGLLVLLTPILILPMQGEVVPLKDARVAAMVERIATRAGAEVEAIREIKVSAKTSRVNAMVTGLGLTKQVIFYDTLLQRFRPDEVEVVVAHEMSHAIHRDVATSWLVNSSLELVTLAGAAWMLRGMVGVGPLRLPAPHAARGLALLLLFTTLAGELTGPIQSAVSRRMEVRADQFALEVTHSPDAFIRTFKKLAADNVADVDPPALVELLSHSHPSILNRIRAAGAR